MTFYMSPGFERFYLTKTKTNANSFITIAVINRFFISPHAFLAYFDGYVKVFSFAY